MSGRASPPQALGRRDRVSASESERMARMQECKRVNREGRDLRLFYVCGTPIHRCANYRRDLELRFCCQKLTRAERFHIIYVL